MKIENGKKDLYKVKGLEHTYTDGKRVYGMVNPDRERFNIIDENTPGANSFHTVEINGRTYPYISNETGDELIKNAVELDKRAGIRNADNSTKKEIKEIVNEIMTGENINSSAESGANEEVKIKATHRKNVNVFTISSDDFDVKKPCGEYTDEDKKTIDELHSAWKENPQEYLKRQKGQQRD